MAAASSIAAATQAELTEADASAGLEQLLALRGHQTDDPTRGRGLSIGDPRAGTRLSPATMLGGGEGAAGGGAADAGAPHGVLHIALTFLQLGMVGWVGVQLLARGGRGRGMLRVALDAGVARGWSAIAGAGQQLPPPRGGSGWRPPSSSHAQQARQHQPASGSARQRMGGMDSRLLGEL
jgi:hypothetical protein